MSTTPPLPEKQPERNLRQSPAQNAVQTPTQNTGQPVGQKPTQSSEQVPQQTTRQSPAQTATQKIFPGQTIGIVGGGQLGRMIAFSAKARGFRVGVLDPTPDCPCAQVCDWQITANYDNQEALRELAERSDVLTYEFENVDAAALKAVASLVAIPQGTRLLQITQERIAEKQYLESVGVPVAPYVPVANATELEAAIAKIGLPAILKTTRGGYDGKGQIVLPNSDTPLRDARDLCAKMPCVLEAKIDFDLELSVLVAGNGRGNYVTLPVGDNEHKRNILHVTTVPARVSESVRERAAEVALKIAQGVNLAGVLAVEMFVAGDQIYVNELAPRPHNSGHYSIEACDFSQFDLHVLGVCGWRLPRPKLLAPAVMVNVLGENLAEAEGLIDEHEDWHFHFYGKTTAKTGRKMGHITVLWGNPETLRKLFV